MSEWRKITLGDFVRLQRGHDLPEAARREGSVPVMGSAGQNGFHDTAKAKGPGVVIGRSGNSMGVVSYSASNYWPHNTVLYVTDFLGNDERFTFYFLQHINLQRFNSGSVQASLNRNFIYPISIKVPLPGEQHAIAHILGSLDDKIDLNRQMNETLEAMARALFKDWFVNFGPVRAKMVGIEPPGLAADIAALFPAALDAEGKPVGWDKRQLSSLARVIKGKSYSSSELAPSKTALVTLKSFNRGGGYRQDGLKEFTGKYKPEQEVFSGDLIISYTDVTQAAEVIGKPALVMSDDRYEHLVISLDVGVLRPLKAEYNFWLYGLALTDEFQNHTRAHTTGTTVLHLAATAVPGFSITFPGDEIISVYHELAGILFEKIEVNIKESKSLERLRDLLLPKLLSGEIRIREAEHLVSELV